MKKLAQKLYKIEDAILIACLGIMGLVLFFQVVMRFVFDSPLMWSEELVRFIQIWIAFLGIGYGIRAESHISMVIVYNKFSEKMQQVISIISNIFILGCFLVFIPHAYNFVEMQHNIASSAMGIKMSIVYIPVVIGSVVYIFYCIADSVSRMKILLNRKQI
ncbi:TRAP transporter small permease [Clostridium sp. DL1XJH146]